MWLDNYSKTFGTRYPGSRTSTSYYSCLWSVSGWFQVPDSFKLTGPLYPPSLFHKLSNLRDLLIEIDELDVDYRSRSVVLQHALYCTPPGPPSDMDASPIETQAFWSSRVGGTFASFTPRGVMGHNVGSNEGLRAVLSEIQLGLGAKKTIILADANIFNRICQVFQCYSYCFSWPFQVNLCFLNLLKDKFVQLSVFGIRTSKLVSRSIKCSAGLFSDLTFTLCDQMKSFAYVPAFYRSWKSASLTCSWPTASLVDHLMKLKKRFLHLWFPTL